MARQVVWNKKAVEKFEEIVKYLEKEVLEKAAIKFVVKLDDLIEKLFKHPVQHASSLRNVMIHKN